MRGLLSTQAAPLEPLVLPIPNSALLLYTAGIHAVPGCEEFADCFTLKHEEFAYCFTLKHFGFAHLRLNVRKAFFEGGAPAAASLKCQYEHYRWQDAG